VTIPVRDALSRRSSGLTPAHVDLIKLLAALAVEERTTTMSKAYAGR
jgi:hypothetical protein